MRVQQDRLLAFIVADPAQDRGGQLDLLPVEHVFAQVDSSRVDAERLELLDDELGHLEDVLAIGGIAADAAGVTREHDKSESGV